MDQEKTYKWIQDRLRELNAGTITEVDFHQLETLAREDPFVADALEGYQLHPDLDHTESLDSLTQKIKPHKRERRRWLIPNLTVTAVAASLILIVGFYAVVTRMSTHENKDMAGATEHQLGIKDSGDTFSIVPDKENSIVAAEPDQPAAAAEVPRAETQRKSVEKPASTKEDKKEIAATSTARSQPADKTYTIEDTKTKGVSPPYGNETDQNILDEQTAVLAETEAKDAGYYANQMNPQVMSQRVTGKVTSIDGDPLIGVNLLVRGTNLVTVSDLGGKFELFLPYGESQVDVAYGGYENAEVTFTPGQEDVHVQLKAIPSYELNAVSGSAAPASRAQNASPKMSTVTIQTNENLLFVDYLKTNTKFPLAENLNAPAKIVTLEFFIGAEGHPGQVKVIQSSGEKNLDDEAVRLIRKGPDWDCGEAKYPCKVKYSIYFKT